MWSDAANFVGFERSRVIPRPTTLTIPYAADFTSIRRQPFVHGAVLQENVNPIEIAVHHAALAVFELCRNGDHASE